AVPLPRIGANIGCPGRSAARSGAKRGDVLQNRDPGVFLLPLARWTTAATGVPDLVTCAKADPGFALTVVFMSAGTNGAKQSRFAPTAGLQASPAAFLPSAACAAASRAIGTRNGE